jgi:NitT/TauT family transport system substrate-binding protein
MRRRFPRLLLLIDTVRIVAFTIIGAKMAIITGSYWFWIPICAAATCAGGGLLLGICTGASRARLPERYMKSSLIGLVPE